MSAYREIPFEEPPSTVTRVSRWQRMLCKIGRHGKVIEASCADVADFKEGRGLRVGLEQNFVHACGHRTKECAWTIPTQGQVQLQHEVNYVDEMDVKVLRLLMLHPTGVHVSLLQAPLELLEERLVLKHLEFMQQRQLIFIAADGFVIAMGAGLARLKGEAPTLYTYAQHVRSCPKCGNHLLLRHPEYTLTCSVCDYHATVKNNDRKSRQPLDWDRPVNRRSNR